MTIGAGAFLGLGVTVNEKITIGENAIVVSGVSIFGDVPANTIVKVDGKPYPRRSS
ncbi:MAG: hypothetical protein ACREJX_10845 [Polyangiaceae bacterium]